MVTDPSANRACSATSAVSGHLDTRTAATEVAHALYDGVGSACDLALVFASYHHRAALADAMETIRHTIDPRTTLAVTTEGVLAGNEELEGVAGMSGIAMHMPGVRLSPWMSLPSDPLPLRDPDGLAGRIDLTDEFRAALVIGEPFSVPITRLLPALSRCGGEGRRIPLIGGMASGASQPGHNVLILDDHVVSGGAIGVSIAGDVGLDIVVSQGCRPIGSPLVITKAERNTVLELGGRPARAVLEEQARSLGPGERDLLAKGMLIGHVVDERRRPFGRGDFLVRNLLGIDRTSGGIMIGDVPRLGQTVQFHVRDAVTAGEDLQLLLDAQVLDESPFAALLFTCNGRGRRLFGRSGHDTGIIADRLGPVPIAGFFAAGEIGPIGLESYLHGHTAALAMFRGVAPTS